MARATKFGPPANLLNVLSVGVRVTQDGTLAGELVELGGNAIEKKKS
jgi:hypothetical protein